MFKRLCQLACQFFLNSLCPKEPIPKTCAISTIKLRVQTIQTFRWLSSKPIIIDALKPIFTLIYDGLETRPLKVFSNDSAPFLQTTLNIQAILFTPQTKGNLSIRGISPQAYKNMSLKIQRPLGPFNSQAQLIETLQPQKNTQKIPILLPSSLSKTTLPPSAYGVKITATALYRLPTEIRRKLRQALAKKTTHPENDIQLLAIFQNLPQAYTDMRPNINAGENSLTLILNPKGSQDGQKASQWTYVVGRSIKNANQMLDTSIETDTLK